MLRLILSTVLAASLASCAIGRDQVASMRPDLLAEFDANLARENALKAELPFLEQAASDAVLSPDPSDDLPAAEALAEANAELAKVEAPLAEIERQVLERTGATVAGPLGAIHPALSALAMAALPLVGRRGRKLYGSALRSASKGQLLVTAAEVIKALGIMHSGQPQPQPPQSASSSQAAEVVMYSFTAAPQPPPAPPA